MHRTLAITLLVGLYFCGAFAIFRIVRVFQMIEAGIDPAFYGTHRSTMFTVLVIAIAGAAVVHAVLARRP